MSKRRLTSVSGAPVADNNNVKTAGPRGPMMLEDVWYLEKLAHFAREVIPERRMHAKGSGAHGTFTVTHDITKYSKAAIFSEVGKETPMFIRFSTVAGERGAADAERDIRGFAMKYYTDEGNWDLVGNNTPVFYLRDPLKFPDLNHVVKRDPRDNMRSNAHKWDFFSHLPESLHQITIDYSDRGLPHSYRHMHGFGSHTFSLINSNNERHWVKFHFRCEQGIENLMDDDAMKLVGMDRESSQRDLFNAIERGEHPRWTMQIQVLTEDQARQLPYNPFDLTKVWRHKDAPLMDVGYFELNRNPDNYFNEVEQVAMNPASVVPGISFSPDKMLQGRLFSYGDAHRYRLGVNHHQIPVNAPKCPFHNYHRDGAMRVDSNSGDSITYEPNSFGLFQESPETAEPPLALEGADDHWNHRQDDDYFSQVLALYNLLSEEEHQRMHHRIASELVTIPQDIAERQLKLFGQVHEAYEAGIRKAMAMSG